jgi:hypothetical protein
VDGGGEGFRGFVFGGFQDAASAGEEITDQDDLVRWGGFGYREFICWREADYGWCFF